MWIAFAILNNENTFIVQILVFIYTNSKLPFTLQMLHFTHSGY
jgi:hypothetical protein